MATLLIAVALATGAANTHAVSSLLAQATGPQVVAPTVPFQSPQRRRIYLLRHGDVSYFDAKGQPVTNPDLVMLSEKGRAQADMAGRYLAGIGIQSLDRVITSNLPRTVETAERILVVLGQGGQPEQWESLREMKNGAQRLPPDQLPPALLGLTESRVPGHVRFLGGESVADLQQRVLPALERLRGDTGWDTALLVLHALVNNAIVSHALTGGRDYLGRFEQSAGCLTILDLGTAPADWIVRGVNVCPDTTQYG